MKKWNAPEMMELAIECTYGNTPTTGATHKYKTKTQQCEYGHNTNFDFCGECGPCGEGKETGTGSETVTPDGLS